MPPTEPRQVRVRALAKVNLCLEVLNKRPDGFHEIRTLFQTISLHDVLSITYKPASRTSVSIDSPIPDNLAVLAATLVLRELRLQASIGIELKKNIPLGGGLGGGSSDAAAVLLSLPVLAGRALSLDRLMALATKLGSDVPFFLLGGCAAGFGRGTELYPVSPSPRGHVLVVTPDLHVSTASAYSALGRTSENLPGAGAAGSRVATALTLHNSPATETCPAPWSTHAVNDFESAVFPQHPILKQIKRTLQAAGASPALLSGSGASLFAVFQDPDTRDRAADKLRRHHTYAADFVPAQRYRSMWLRALAAYAEPHAWPPQPIKN